MAVDQVPVRTTRHRRSCLSSAVGGFTADVGSPPRSQAVQPQARRRSRKTRVSAAKPVTSDAASRRDSQPSRMPSRRRAACCSAGRSRPAPVRTAARLPRAETHACGAGKDVDAPSVPLRECPRHGRMHTVFGKSTRAEQGPCERAEAAGTGRARRHPDGAITAQRRGPHVIHV